MIVHPIGPGGPVYIDSGPRTGMWRLSAILYLDDGERAMLDRPCPTLIADGFPLQASDDDVKTDLELTCGTCGEHICDAETGDELDTLARLAHGHQCLRTPSGKVITRDELDALTAEAEGGYDLVPCDGHLDYHRDCAACRIVPAAGGERS